MKQSNIIYLDNNIFKLLCKHPDFVGSEWLRTQLHPDLKTIKGWFVGEHTFEDALYNSGGGIGQVYSKSYNGRELAHWDFSNVEVIDGFISDTDKFTIDISQWDWSNVKEVRNALCECDNLRVSTTNFKWDLPNLVKAENFLNNINRRKIIYYGNNITTPKLKYGKNVFM